MVSKRELEEKRRKEEEEAAHVFEEFIETFQQPTDKLLLNKIWVKSGIFNGKSDEQASQQTLYKPFSKLKCAENKSSLEQAQECARIVSADRKKNDSLTKRKKSNLESFKEELEQIHKDREERQKSRNENTTHIPEVEILSDDPNDPLTTNLYVNNLHPKITEYTLMELFGTYGPLASVKIMWPRTEDEKSRTKNHGFVAYMSRKDAERALRNLENSKFMDCELKVGWGKPILVPPFPIYVPPALLELSQPPPETGLPFNAQPFSQDGNIDLKNCIVKVVIPTNRTILALIHRMIEFVIREGLLFEAIMMNREMNNPSFRFLFDNQSPHHIYYRWKLYSILQGDPQRQWRTKEFRMFENGPIWQPPMIIDYTQGMPSTLINSPQKKLTVLKKNLSKTQRDFLEGIIHKLTPERKKVLEAMVYCIEHSEASDEILDCLIQSLETNSIKKNISRMYLLNDILYNSKIFPAAKSYFKFLEKKLSTILNTLQNFYDPLEDKDKMFFYLKITKIFDAWSNFKLLQSESIEDISKFLDNLRPIDGFSLSEPEAEEPIIETVPIKETQRVTEKPPIFAPSRWETIDPELIETQAMTTSKWSEFMTTIYDKTENDNKREISEEKRKKLREIELIVMEYQDKLESQNVKPRSAILEKVEQYRTKLINDYEKDEKNKKRKKKRKSRSRSPKRKYQKYN